MQIRCGTFNLYQFVEPPFAWYEPKNFYSDVDWLMKKEWIKKQILDMKCDVIGFQEVFSTNALKNLVEEVGFTHFTTVETPVTDINKPLVFIKPVVAIASKYPILSVSPVKVPDSIIEEIPVETTFKFSRIPIKATIRIGSSRDIVCYVSHLKSKKPAVKDLQFTPSDTWDKKILETLRARSIGHVASLLQRGAEAAVLYREISETLHTHKELPIILLGDLNDDEHSIPIEALTNREKLLEIGGKVIPKDEQKIVYDYKLYDAFDLAPNQSGQKRLPTHYYGKLGNVLDYIFVSNALNEKNEQYIGRVSEYRVFDRHLKCDDIENQTQSDHAQVVATIKFKEI
ncbi:endonuclease/exonuclease/phosphatase family protein [Bacillus pseudomycoides]|uniref:endonuclease/exonuclease/phosphatase family protein n=1 Tax=Bacillus pseudomycoides TaxID=64104 RepID=UPI000BF5FE53|nr:endonuclease/exonuclease/phosphatase family protein [Bacillus pseudomycoides]PEP87433.1 endonuclease [Bacillus pseudomycoides]PGF08958.1 endonuclease [Bacillus pseudomycoides]